MINVLSLFDGCSCGQVALNRAGIKYDKYYAYEIDEPSIMITQKHYPKTIQLGDVRTLSKNHTDIDLLIGGSPCQDLSNCGHRLGLEGVRSSLFYYYVKALTELKPKHFLFENVVMKKEWRDIITSHLGVAPVKINSSLVSAQNRERLYWTNIPISEIKDEKIYVEDILEQEPRCYFHEICRKADPLLVKVAEVFKGPYDSPKELTSNKPQSRRVYCIKGKSVCLCAGGKGRGALTGLYYIDENCVRDLTPIECERLQNLPDDYTRGPCKTIRYRLIGNGWTVNVIAHILKGLLCMKTQ